MRKRNLLLATCIAMTCSGLALAQTSTGGAGGTGGAQGAQSQGAQNQSAAPQTNAGRPTSPPGAQTPVRQPATSPSPSAPTTAQGPPTQSPPTSSSPTSPAPSTPTSATNAMPQQTVSPNEPNSARTTQDTAANRSRVATQTDPVPPASRGVGTTNNKPDCSQLRGIEKSECERRDTVRDDLPAGVTATQQAKPPR